MMAMYVYMYIDWNFFFFFQKIIIYTLSLLLGFEW